MAKDSVDIRSVADAIDPDDPCGPDLDLEGDPDYFGVTSRIEGLLPASYFRRDDEGRQQVFDRSTIEFAAELKQLSGLLARTRDLRLMTLNARLCALNRDLHGFADTMTGIAGLLAERWEEVHPRGEGADFMFRTAVLGALDDMPTVVLPLQHVPLATSRRFGPISFRSLMAANGEVQPSEGEPALDRATIERVLGEAELDDLTRVRDDLAAVRNAADGIRATTLERLDFEGAVTLDRLPALVGRILAAVEPIIVARDPSAAPLPETGDAGAPDAAPLPGAPGPSRPAGSVGSAAAARRVLAAVSGYFGRHEPSSPARPLVRQAEGLVGRSFVDVIRTLVPNQAEEARIGMGGDRVFSLSFQQLADVSSGMEDETETSAEEEGEEDGEQPALASRADAVAAMQGVIAFYRRAEPSSPIPLLLERAIGTTERDFMTLLKDVLPDLFVRND